jgi:hypothetical protein
VAGLGLSTVVNDSSPSNVGVFGLLGLRLPPGGDADNPDMV